MRKSYVIAFVIFACAALWMMPAFMEPKAAVSQDTEAAAVEGTEQQQADKKTMRVKVRNISPQDMSERIQVNGQTKASRVVDIRARTAGRFSKVLIERGPVVKKGDVIAQMDVDDRQAVLDRARAVLKQRTTEYEVAQGLKAKGYNSQVKLETARANLQIAKADLRQASLDMSYIKVKAPFTGILEDRKVEIGTYVGVGDVVADMVDLDPMDVRSFVSEQHIAKVSLGDEAEVVLPSGETYTGKVFYIATTANTDTRTFRVDIRIENPDHQITSGLTAKVHFLLPTRKAYELPLSAMVLNDKGIIGVKVTEQNTEEGTWVAKFMPVKMLEEKVTTVWVDGLEGDVKVIVTGHEFVTNGQVVEVTEEAATP